MDYRARETSRTYHIDARIWKDNEARYPAANVIVSGNHATIRLFRPTCLEELHAIASAFRAECPEGIEDADILVQGHVESQC